MPGARWSASRISPSTQGSRGRSARSQPRPANRGSSSRNDSQIESKLWVAAWILKLPKGCHPIYFPAQTDRGLLKPDTSTNMQTNPKRGKQHNQAKRKLDNCKRTSLLFGVLFQLDISAETAEIPEGVLIEGWGVPRGTTL